MHRPALQPSSRSAGLWPAPRAAPRRVLRGLPTCTPRPTQSVRNSWCRLESVGKPRLLVMKAAVGTTSALAGQAGAGKGGVGNASAGRGRGRGPTACAPQTTRPLRRRPMATPEAQKRSSPASSIPARGALERLAAPALQVRFAGQVGPQLQQHAQPRVVVAQEAHLRGVAGRVGAQCAAHDAAPCPLASCWARAPGSLAQAVHAPGCSGMQGAHGAAATAAGSPPLQAAPGSTTPMGRPPGPRGPRAAPPRGCAATAPCWPGPPGCHSRCGHSWRPAAGVAAAAARWPAGPGARPRPAPAAAPPPSRAPAPRCRRRSRARGWPCPPPARSTATTAAAGRSA